MPDLARVHEILDTESREGLRWDDAELAMAPFLWAEWEREHQPEEWVLTKHEGTFEAGPGVIKAALKGLWTELGQAGISPQEFERHWNAVKDVEDRTAGPDGEWLAALDLPNRFERHLEAIKDRLSMRHMAGGGKSVAQISERIVSHQAGVPFVEDPDDVDL